MSTRRRRDRRRGRSMPDELLRPRLDNIRAGDVGSLPVLVGLIVITVFFSLKADNFLSPGNFNNLITQMAGVTMIAIGVVFVLLIGEIDLSIGYLGGIAGRRRREAEAPGRDTRWPGSSRSCSRSRGRADRRVPGLVRGVHRRAVVRRHARGLPALAGRDPEDDRRPGRDPDPGRDVNDTANYFFSDTAGWILAAVVSGVYAATVLGQHSSAPPRTACADREPLVRRREGRLRHRRRFFVIYVCNKDRGVPFVRLLIIASLLIF